MPTKDTKNTVQFPDAGTNPDANSTTSSKPVPPSPRPRSQAQIEAARRNGAKSRGPKTPEGKAISSRNNFKHGAYAKRDHAVLAIEDSEEFNRFLDDFVLGYACIDRAEFEIVRRIAVAQWHHKRWSAVETALLDSATTNSDPGLNKLQRLTTGIRRLDDNSAILRSVGSQKKACSSEISRAQRDLFALQARRGRVGPFDERSAFEPKRPLTINELLGMEAKLEPDSNPAPDHSNPAPVGSNPASSGPSTEAA